MCKFEVRKKKLYTLCGERKIKSIPKISPRPQQRVAAIHELVRGPLCCFVVFKAFHKLTQTCDHADKAANKSKLFFK